MIESEKKLLNLKDGWASSESREERRLKALSDLGLYQPEMVPVFEEATQTAAHFLEAPISILGFIDQERHWFKSAVGLSRLGLMNQLAQARQLSRKESFCTQVVDSSQTVIINDSRKLADADVSKLVQEFGIRAYLGAPLIDAAGNCLGSLAVMDLVPRNFTPRDVEFLQIIARWCMSEFERNRMLQVQGTSVQENNGSSNGIGNGTYNSVPPIWSPPETTVTNEIKIAPGVFQQSSELSSTNQLKLELLSQLTQELRTPLTSVLGMASVLGREIYGPLTGKQREYVDIIQHSGRYLLSLVNEISELGTIDENTNVLNLAPVDIEMLCQQAINTLEEVATRREQDIRLSIEPGRSRILPLDKDKVRQILYHLVFSVIQLSATGSVVRIHVSYKEDALNMTVWVSHPWLGDGITEVDPYFRLNPVSLLEMAKQSKQAMKYNFYPESEEQLGSLPLGFENSQDLNFVSPNSINSSVNDAINIASVMGSDFEDRDISTQNNLSRESLGLLLSCQLAELHGGQISILGSAESGYRYVLSLPVEIPLAEVAEARME
ncbi:MAG: GAF domain-containing protein [Scytonematopsis contorta HA4267-MV1]|jgi:signal transduction histidine kinase|nr:GAF domain-containing protein [Scytonematopsis contorta HA4267-MV1]